LLKAAATVVTAEPKTMGARIDMFHAGMQMMSSAMDGDTSVDGKGGDGSWKGKGGDGVWKGKGYDGGWKGKGGKGWGKGHK
jgi:hypothetical protein